jgi:hypothetical protein
VHLPVAGEAEPVRFGRPAPPPPPLYPGFFKTALVFTTLFGTGFGAFNLLVIHLSLGNMPPSHQWTHASYQIWGFVFLFIAGTAFQAVPRMLGEGLRLRGPAKAVLPLTIAAQVFVTWGRLPGYVPFAEAGLAAGAALQLAAALAFAASLGATLRAARTRPAAATPFLAAGILGWVGAAGLLAASAVEGLLEGDAEAAIRWNQAVYAAALFGGTLAWIQGMFVKTSPVMLGLPAPGRAPLVGSLALGQAGMLAIVAGSLRIGKPGGVAAMDAGLLGVAASVALFTAALNPFRSSQPGVRAAFAGALIFSFLGTIYGVWDLASGAPALLHDGARHAYTVGFVTLLIFALAGRIVPGLTGRELAKPRLHRSGLAMIFAGLLLREAQVLAAVFAQPALMWISGFSGLLAFAGVVHGSVSLWATMKSRP